MLDYQTPATALIARSRKLTIASVWCAASCVVCAVLVCLIDAGELPDWIDVFIFFMPPAIAAIGSVTGLIAFKTSINGRTKAIIFAVINGLFCLGYIAFWLLIIFAVRND